MDHYVVTLAILIVPLTFAAYWHHDHALSKLVLISADEVNRLDMMDDEIHDVNHETTAERFFSFCNNFLWVYGLVMAAEWLQAAYLYSALKNSHRLSEPCIAYLFATGFVCAGTGTLFTWMVAEFRKEGFAKCDGAVGVIQSSMAVTNGLVAVGSGIVAQMVASTTESQTAPFAVSLICLVMALFIISRTWIENSGLHGSALEPANTFTKTELIGAAGFLSG
ncbi:major facilitator superfamily domain-containing protein [Fusarium heterosporum]|uniref:Major facilitator superfamily domain-containing protein n=1 Tax=Fusarium heterosporum TaxID=42747 RepID=A0A8H5TW08_FUSHE|nr:major facilitator superfamily domain-containing protein [Fusarium heterosporum]